jgi:thiamine-phosphate pyrophosphorylase
VVIQYRDKSCVEPLSRANALLKLCRQQNIPLIINDNIALAAEIGADGVHLGRDDGDIHTARQLLGATAIIGVSCYNDLNLALKAENQGATYVAFGRFFPSESKPLATPASLETLRQANQKLTIPIVAIGGILPENGEALLRAGANLLAVINGIFRNDSEISARAYQALFLKTALKT